MQADAVHEQIRDKGHSGKVSDVFEKSDEKQHGKHKTRHGHEHVGCGKKSLRDEVTYQGHGGGELGRDHACGQGNTGKDGAHHGESRRCGECKSSKNNHDTEESTPQRMGGDAIPPASLQGCFALFCDMAVKMAFYPFKTRRGYIHGRLVTCPVSFRPFFFHDGSDLCIFFHQLFGHPGRRPSIRRVA